MISKMSGKKCLFVIMILVYLNLGIQCNRATQSDPYYNRRTPANDWRGW